MKIIDTHQHIWELERFSYSWCSSVPSLNRTFSLEDYLDASDGTGIERTVHVEADVDEAFMLAETKYVLSLAAAETPIVGVVACARPESTDFPAYLDEIAGHPQLKGVRRLLQAQADDLSEGSVFRDNVRLLPRYDLSFDICVLARQLPVAIALVEECPEVQFILDHCGNPLILEGRLEDWRRDLRRLAAYPNISCKISGIVTQADHMSWTAKDLRPIVEHVIECFGWDRVMFGSDWPVCTLSTGLRRWVETLLDLTRGAGEKNQHKLFYENAVRIYRLTW